MQVIIIKTPSGNYTMKPADQNDTTILMIGVASLASVKNTCKKRQYTIVGKEDRTK